MFETLRAALLRWLRVPEAPEAPAGSKDSIRVFRAGANFYKWSVITWGLRQIAVGVGLAGAFTALTVAQRSPSNRPEWVNLAFPVGQVMVAAAFVLQLLLSYAALRLNFEMRWYIVTDRSLRIRSGIWSIEELTMTFANIQQVNLTQDPLQRVLGVADLEVTSAGGGGAKKKRRRRGQREDAHTAAFEGVDNAESIRDLILERLRRYRDTGLGHPEEAHEARDEPMRVQQAAELVLLEARELRKTISA